MSEIREGAAGERTMRMGNEEDLGQLTPSSPQQRMPVGTSSPRRGASSSRESYSGEGWRLEVGGWRWQRKNQDAGRNVRMRAWNASRTFPPEGRPWSFGTRVRTFRGADCCCCC